MKRFFMVLAVVLVLTALLVTPALAMSAQQAGEPDIIDVLVQLSVGFGTLVGTGALISALVGILKLIPNLITDGNSGRWYAGLSLVAFVALGYFQVFKPDIGLDFLDQKAAQVATLLIFVSGFLGQLLSGFGWYKLFKNLNLPILGTSYSKK